MCSGVSCMMSWIIQAGVILGSRAQLFLLAKFQNGPISDYFAPISWFLGSFGLCIYLLLYRHIFIYAFVLPRSAIEI